MTHLGDFGTEYEAEEFTFGYFGSEIRVHPEFSELELHDFMEKASEVDENSSDAMTLVKGLYRSAIHPEDFDQFWTLSKRNRQTSEDLMKVLHRVLEAMTDRPTGQPADSSDGLPKTEVRSRPDFYSRALTRLGDEGRPDLQEAVVLRLEALQEVSA